jgi:hypothetical protein
MFRTPISTYSTSFKHITLKTIQFCLIAVCTAVFSGCLEDTSSANTNDVTQLMSDLHSAVLSENEDALDEIITKASKLPQTDSIAKAKKLILSTARAKLGKIQYQKISTETSQVITDFQHAVRVANQASLLRNAANTMSNAAEQSSDDAAAAFQSSMEQVKKSLNTQLDLARGKIARLSLESEDAAAMAETLFNEANELLVEAEGLDDVARLKPFKQGMNVMRKSDRAHLTAISSEVESNIIATPEVKNASAQLEAIASQLNGIRHSMELLASFRQASKESAGQLRSLADSRDNECATILTHATASASELLTRWKLAAELLNNSLSSRISQSTGSKQSKAATAFWELETAWSLGQMQESQVQFIAEECTALTEIIHAGIVTGTSKWETLLTSCRLQLDSLTATAITSYETAKKAAGKLGRDGEGPSFQLDVRIAKLSGTDAPLSTQVSSPSTPTAMDNASPSNSNGSSEGFSSPQELVAFINETTQSKTSIDLSKIYETKTNEQKNMLGKLQSLFNNTVGLRDAINSTFGNGTSSKIAMLSNSIIPDAIDPHSIVMDGDTKATLPMNPISVILVKTNRGWLIDFESHANAEGFNAQKIAEVEKLSSAFKKVKDQIENGQIADENQIEFAIMTSMM